MIIKLKRDIHAHGELQNSSFANWTTYHDVYVEQTNVEQDLQRTRFDICNKKHIGLDRL